MLPSGPTGAAGAAGPTGPAPATDLTFQFSGLASTTAISTFLADGGTTPTTPTVSPVNTSKISYPVTVGKTVTRLSIFILDDLASGQDIILTLQKNNISTGVVHLFTGPLASAVLNLVISVAYAAGEQVDIQLTSSGPAFEIGVSAVLS